MEVIDGGNPYSLNNLNDFNKSNNFNNNTLNNYYIFNSLSNGYSSTVSNNSITLTVKSKAISVDYIIFLTNKGYARDIRDLLALTRLHSRSF